MSDYIPKKVESYVEWLRNLEIKTPVRGLVFGLTQAQIDAFVARVVAQIARQVRIENAKTELKAAYDDAATGKDETDPFIRTQVGVWKTMPGFTHEDEVILRVIGTFGSGTKPSESEMLALKVKFTAKVVGNEVRLDWTKGPFEAVNVYARRRGDKTWVKIGMDTSSPYLDSRPLPAGIDAEVREYMMRGVIADVEVTGDSDSVSVAFPG